ncbi:ATP-grasp domain-containing protein [Variovorax sp. J22R133]|uniref:ATP-grasp domain-containing protein n=1 Tax=Variovorax brevis TaxID=3053503 RepID=UPI00257640BC|nr:ATP-grasp domain-containing protein [Variovorax sp. J22R133]MDM0115986.1 ATP-grasp domain-containing protein [Variovorax sp. J22R133]
MKRIFVYEHLSGGAALTEGDDAAAQELLAMGQSMRDAVVADLLALENYDVSVATCKLASPVAEPARPVMAADGESAFDFVARQAGEHDLSWVIAPETDGVLATLRQRVAPRRWLGCEAHAIQLATRKRATLMALAETGIATPLAFEHEPDISRWVVKPDDGAGAIATRLHHEPEAAIGDWSQRSRAGCATAIEPWVEGPALSLSMLCTAKKCELLSINRQNLSIDDSGLLAFRGVEINAVPLSDARAAQVRLVADRVYRAIAGLRGFVGIDFVWHKRTGPVVIEINPRVTCAYVGLSRALGRNVAAEVVATVGAERGARATHGHH